MAKFIPYEKLSKKEKRKRDAARRKTWSMNPVTRRAPDPKAYNRRKARKWEEDPGSGPFDFFAWIGKKSLTFPLGQGVG